MSKSTYSVLFQTGGYINYSWKPVLDTFLGRAEADAKRDELIAAGYPAMIYKTSELDAIGGPDDYAVIDAGVVRFTGRMRHLERARYCQAEALANVIVLIARNCRLGHGLTKRGYRESCDGFTTQQFEAAFQVCIDKGYLILNADGFYCYAAQ